MYDLVQHCVETHLDPGWRRRLRAGKVVCLDVTNRAIDGYCYLLFGDADDEPVVVAKAARTGPGRAVFDVEYGNLVELHRAGMNEAWPATPEPLGRWLEADALVTFQSALAGEPMKNVPGAKLFSPRGVESSVNGVYRWWERLQGCFPAARSALTGTSYDDAVLAPVRRFQRRYELAADEIEFLDRRFQLDRPLEGLDLPFMVRHGDFCTANMVLGMRGIGVFDWEFPLLRHTPLFDLFFFFSSVRFPYGWYRGESDHFASFVSVFWGESYFSEAMRRGIARACEQYRIPRASVADLFVLSLIQVANMKYEGLLEAHGLGDDAASEPIPDELKRARWSSFKAPDKNAPFACLRSGVFENLRHVVRHGPPRF